MLTSTVALHLSAALGSVAVIIGSLETLARPRLLADTALTSWVIARTRTPWLSSKFLQGTLGQLLAYPRVFALIVLRLACAVLLIIGVSSVNALAASVVAATFVLTSMRSHYGTDGADEMSFLIFASLALAFWFGSEQAQVLALWFLALQACLAYFTAGVAKLVSSEWRRGEAIKGILGTEMYGQPWAASVLSRHSGLATVMCWSAIAFECSFPLVLLGVKPLTYALLIGGAVFHIGTAIVMRLNTFLWAFVATYPAIAFCVAVQG